MQEQKRTFKYGDVFHVAGLDWIVLRTTPAPTPGRSDLHFCEATEDVFQAPFDENDCNDWNKASLRKQLNGEFLDKLIAECPSLKDAIVPTYRDLTADDGLRDYGNCLDNVTMLTADEYRQTRDLHPPGCALSAPRIRRTRTTCASCTRTGASATATRTTASGVCARL